MTDIDVVFCRRLLSNLRADPDFRATGKRLYKDAWVWSFGRDQWEFHGPGKFHWNGRAANAYDARFKGWSMWLDRQKEPA